MLDKIANGRTDLVFDYLAAGHDANSTDRDGVSLMQWCAYYGDVSPIKFLLTNGESLDSPGDTFGLIGACFHGHWRLCQFLIERGADVNRPLHDTGETALHSALCTANRGAHNLVLKVLLVHRANPNSRRFHARLPHQRRDAASPRGRGRRRRGYPTALGRRSRRQGHEWRFSTQIGQLVLAASAGS